MFKREHGELLACRLCGRPAVVAVGFIRPAGFCLAHIPAAIERLNKLAARHPV